MGALTNLLGSSSTLLVLCAGVSLTMGLLHLWTSRRAWDTNWWVALWSGLACVFLAARGIQLTTTDPAAALSAGKVSICVGPYLVWTLVGFGRSLGQHTTEADRAAPFAWVSVLWTLAIFATPWFVSPEVTTRQDLFGVEHYSVHSRSPSIALACYLAGTVIWGLHRLRTRRVLERNEHLALVAGFAIYGTLGVCAILTTAGVIAIPAMAEFGPFVVSVSLTYLMVQRQLHVETQLEGLLGQESSRLAASEQRYANLVDLAPIGVLACDGAGEITAINRRMSDMICCASSSDSNDSPLLLPLEGSGLQTILDRVRAQGEAIRLEHRPFADAALHNNFWQVTARPLDGTADESGVLLVADDITEHRQLEHQLYQAQKMEAIGQLAAGIAHEINNPMTFVRANLSAIAGYVEERSLHSTNADSKPDDFDELDTLVSETIEGVERTIAIVRDMREFAHAGDEEATPLLLAPVVESCVRFASTFHQRDSRIIREIPPDLEVQIGNGLLRQVILNLLINALQAVDGEGNVWVEASRDPEITTVRVHDDGPGIEEGARARVFDPFYTTKAVGEGTGLGLYISYQIARSWGGDLSLSTGPHGGAQLTLTIPDASTLIVAAPDPA